MKKIAFIGTGNMGGALIKAACKAVDPKEVLITNRTLAKAQELADQLGCCVAQNNLEAVKNAFYVVLCVKPQVINGVLEEIAPVVRAESKKRELVLTTIVVGKKIADYTEIIGLRELPVIRTMPNMPAAIGRGMTIAARNEFVKDAQMQEYFSLMKESGLMEEVAEDQMNAAGNLSGCAPAWVFMFIEALADGAVQTGVPRKSAVKYAAQTVLGAAQMVLETGKHPGELKDAVCSPGGTTITGVRALEDRGFRGAAMSAVTAAYEKTIGMK
ncbi:pyrroline-5-carboxylate reductase [Caproicibacterium sp. NSD3]